LRAYKRELFGASSESRESDQIGLFDEAEAPSIFGGQPTERDSADAAVSAHTYKKRGRKPLDPRLPREVVRHKLPEPKRFFGHDGHALGAETRPAVPMER
jgi:hypothetical protein